MARANALKLTWLPLRPPTLDSLCWSTVPPHIELAASGLVLLLLAGGLPNRGALADEIDPRRWEPAIAAFEREDQTNGPPQGGILFVGSSSIRRWDTARDFPGIPILNRGFGGSQLSDVLHYFDRIVAVYQPRLVVLYEGDNDIANGESAEQIAAEFRDFVDKLQTHVPQARLVFLSIKPSLSRWHIYREMRKANDLIKAQCQTLERCEFVDVSSVMLGDDGRPIESLFVNDGLHLSPSGYNRWAERVKPYLMVDDQALDQ